MTAATGRWWWKTIRLLADGEGAPHIEDDSVRAGAVDEDSIYLAIRREDFQTYVIRLIEQDMSKTGFELKREGSMISAKRTCGMPSARNDRRGMMHEENCGNCCFWRNGECRFAFPDSEHGWPKTSSIDWCGDYDRVWEELEPVSSPTGPKPHWPAALAGFAIITWLSYP